MADGTVKPISEVKVGDYVLTAEPSEKKKEKHKVKEVIVTKTDRNYVDVVVDTKAAPRRSRPQSTTSSTRPPAAPGPRQPTSGPATNSRTRTPN